MVLYFSATGNTRYIAEIIAKKLEDEAIDLTKRIKNHDYSLIRSRKPFVICCPIYLCEMPKFFTEYLRYQRFAGNRKIYFIFTSGGGYSGIAGAVAEAITRRKNMTYMGHADFKMPNNYMVSNLNVELETEEILDRIYDCHYKAVKVASIIKQCRKIPFRHVTVLEKMFIIPIAAVYMTYMQSSKDFYSNSKCVGCGKCAAVCPVNNISIKNKRPVWKGPCAHCMACIGNCPAEAIEYADITQKKTKYNIKKYLKKDI